MVEKNEKRNATGALWMGILSLVCSVLGGYLAIASLVLGTAAVFLGRKQCRRFERRSLWSMVFGSVGIFLSLIAVFGMYKDYQYAEKAASTYAEELGLPIPDKYPIIHNVDSELYPSLFEEHVSEYLYYLDYEEAHKLSNKITNDYRWDRLPMNGNIAERFELFIPIPENGYYMVYNRMNSGAELPVDYETYDFVIVVFDDTANELIIWNFRG
jgi:hypothetical protein